MCDSVTLNFNGLKHGRSRLPFFGCDLPSNLLQIQDKNRVKHRGQEQRNNFGHRESNETSLTHERPTRPISKARALGRETGSTFCSRGPDRHMGCLPSEGDSLETEGESSGRKQVTG